MDVGICEAKRKLLKLLKSAEAGEEVIITRRGQPVAKIVGIRTARGRDRAQLLREVRALSRRVRIPKGISIRKLMGEGRC